MDKKKEQFAVYEKEPAHGKAKDGVILAPYNTREEAETAQNIIKRLKSELSDSDFNKVARVLSQEYQNAMVF